MPFICHASPSMSIGTRSVCLHVCAIFLFLLMSSGFLCLVVAVLKHIFIVKTYNKNDAKIADCYVEVTPNRSTMVSLPKLVLSSVCSQTYDSWCKSPTCILLTRWFLARPSRAIMKISSRLCSRNGLRPGDAMSLALPNAEWKWKRLFSIQLRAIYQKY